LIGKWIEECSLEVTECHQTNTPLPTRVSNLGQSFTEAPKIRYRQGLSAQYCALSHCWDTTQPVRTTESNLGQIESGISFPRALKDIPGFYRDLQPVINSILID
jgi:hypothetical protein